MRRLPDLADENSVVAEPIDNLLAGQTFGYGELVSHHTMCEQLILDLVHAHARLERVFAAFERAPIAIEQGENVEPRRAVDHSRAFELIGDAAGVVLAHDHDHLVGGEGPGASQFLQEPRKHADRRERSEQYESEKSA